MLGGSLAAQPEHETISVNRMGSPPFFSGILRLGLYHRGCLQLPIANCQLKPCAMQQSKTLKSELSIRQVKELLGT